MEHNEFLVFLDSIFQKYNFTLKRNHWYNKLADITKVINLQKSSYNKSYYINYGYNINSVPLDGTSMHIYMRLASVQKEENKRIIELLDFENNLIDEIRKKELEFFILKYLIDQFKNINNENELKEYLVINNVPTVPLIVKKHFSIA